MDNLCEKVIRVTLHLKSMCIISLRYYYIGKTGDWKNYFSPELNNRIDEWINRNLIETDLQFLTELEE